MASVLRDQILPFRRDEEGRSVPSPTFPLGTWFCHHGFSGLISVRGSPASRLWFSSACSSPALLTPARGPGCTPRGQSGAPSAGARSPDSCPQPRVAPVAQAALAGHSSTPRPDPIPAVSAPVSGRLEVGLSPCALREVMSRGPGPGPEPRLVVKPRGDAAAGGSARARTAPQDRLSCQRRAGA